VADCFSEFIAKGITKIGGATWNVYECRRCSSLTTDRWNHARYHELHPVLPVPEG
jgi:hypothetical protein